MAREAQEELVVVKSGTSGPSNILQEGGGAGAKLSAETKLVFRLTIHHSHILLFFYSYGVRGLVITRQATMCTRLLQRPPSCRSRIIGFSSAIGLMQQLCSARSNQAEFNLSIQVHVNPLPLLTPTFLFFVLFLFVIAC